MRVWGARGKRASSRCAFKEVGRQPTPHARKWLRRWRILSGLAGSSNFVFTPFGYYGPCKKLFLSVWTLSSAGIVLFVSIQIVGHFDYGQRNLEFGLFLVGVLILGLMLAALATFLNLILMGFPHVSFHA